jgi:hypothetical protein
MFIPQAACGGKRVAGRWTPDATRPAASCIASWCCWGYVGVARPDYRQSSVTETQRHELLRVGRTVAVSDHRLVQAAAAYTARLLRLDDARGALQQHVRWPVAPIQNSKEVRSKKIDARGTSAEGEAAELHRACTR